MNKEQQQAIIDAGVILKAAFADDNIQICFNLSPSHSNVNYNFKKSGILNPKTKMNL